VYLNKKKQVQFSKQA